MVALLLITTILLFVLCLILMVRLSSLPSMVEKIDNSELKEEREQLFKEIKSKKAEKDSLEKVLNQTRIKLNTEESKIKSLENSYSLKERNLKLSQENQRREYENQTKKLNDFKVQIAEEKLVLKKELDSLKATRDAAIEAARKELEIEKEVEKYCIQLSEDEIHDINYIDSVRHNLKYPEILGKLIWQVYLQKKYKTLVANILGKEQVTGIYKITCRTTKESYIGRSVDVGKRWGEHIKAGCGAVQISSTNKLYTTMRKYGVQDFTFELLEECSSEELPKKEAFFIELYSSDTLGLNSQKGNN